MKCSFNIPPKWLKAVALFASRDQTRYVINGVQVELMADRTIILVATDGRRLLAVAPKDDITNVDCDEWPASFIIPDELIEAMPPIEHPKSTLRVSYADNAHGGGDVTISGNYDVSRGAVPGNYPNWRQVVPDEISEHPAIYASAPFLEAFVKAATMIWPHTPGAVIHGNAPHEPLVIYPHPTANNKEQFVAVLMPMSARDERGVPIDPAKHAVPQWIRKTDKPVTV